MSYNAVMISEQLRQARLRRGHTQQQAAARMGVTQAYFSMLENGEREPSSTLARRLMLEYKVPPTVLPVSDVPPKVTPVFMARELAALGYPGFAHLRRGSGKMNPAEYLLTAVSQSNLEARVVEGLPWLVARYPDMDFGWLVPQARIKNLQNRLGFVVTLAKAASRNAALEVPERALLESKLAREDSFKELNEAERRWLRKHQSEEAQQWNFLSDLRPDQLRYHAA